MAETTVEFLQGDDAQWNKTNEELEAEGPCEFCGQAGCPEDCYLYGGESYRYAY